MFDISFKRVLTTVKNNFKINKSVPTLIFIFTAIVLFLSTTLAVSSAESQYVAKVIDPERYSWYERSIYDCWSTITGIQGLQAVFAIILAIGTAFLASVSLTAFSRDKKASDFWNSQALTRQEHLIANLISGFLYYAVSLIPSWFLSLALAHMFTTVPPLTLGEVFARQTPVLLFILLFYLCILSVAFLANTVAGSVMSALVFFGTLLGYPALLAIFTGFVSQDIFDTYLMDILEHNYLFFTYSSPVLRYFFAFNEVYPLTVGDYLLYAITTALIIALLLFLVRRKKTELAQNAVVFPILRYPLQYLWSFFFTLFIAWFLYAIIRSPLWFAVGAVIGLVVSFMILNMVFEKGLSGIFKKTSHLFISGGIFIVVCLVFVADVFGIYKEPLPDLNRVRDFNLYVNTDHVVDGATEWSWLDVYSSNDELNEKDKEVLEYVYSYLYSKPQNQYKVDEDQDAVWYSVSINVWCENDPSGWYTHRGFYSPDSEFLAAIDYLCSRFESNKNSEREMVTKEVVYKQTDEDFQDVVVIEPVPESEEISN